MGLGVFLITRGSRLNKLAEQQGLERAIEEQRKRDHILRSSGIATIDSSDGVFLEQRLSLLFKDRGFTVKMTKITGDFGADLIVYTPEAVLSVQAKSYGPGKTVGVAAVQEVLGSLKMYGATRGLVVTNRSFTPAAQQLARANNIELWDRARLIHELSQTPREAESLPDATPRKLPPPPPPHPTEALGARRFVGQEERIHIRFPFALSKADYLAFRSRTGGWYEQQRQAFSLLAANQDDLLKLCSEWDCEVKWVSNESPGNPSQLVPMADRKERTGVQSL